MPQDVHNIQYFAKTQNKNNFDSHSFLFQTMEICGSLFTSPFTLKTRTSNFAQCACQTQHGPSRFCSYPLPARQQTQQDRKKRKTNRKRKSHKVRYRKYFVETGGDSDGNGFCNRDLSPPFFHHSTHPHSCRKLMLTMKDIELSKTVAIWKDYLEFQYTSRLVRSSLPSFLLRTCH